MPALLAAVMKWEPICGIRGIEFLADLHINSRVWLTYSYIEYAPASIEKIRSLSKSQHIHLLMGERQSGSPEHVPVRVNTFIHRSASPVASGGRRLL